ncbi:hypothetical protein B0H11DRAFT_1932335 [Mycena galericulata]|nr:hypothetical protein B0H11DRAFT_1932335 [Mycena galericulata]
MRPRAKYSLPARHLPDTATLQPVLVSVSLADASTSVLELITWQWAVQPALDIENLSLKNTPMADHKSTAKIELERLEARLRMVQLTLEILTGSCATLPDPDPDMPPGQADSGDKGRVPRTIPDVDMALDANLDANVPAQALPALVSPLLVLIQLTRLLPAARAITVPTHDVCPERDPSPRSSASTYFSLRTRRARHFGAESGAGAGAGAVRRRGCKTESYV